MVKKLICETCEFYKRYRLVRQTLNQKRVRGSEQDYMDCIKGIRYLVANQCVEFSDNQDAHVKATKGEATAQALQPEVTIE